MPGTRLPENIAVVIPCYNAGNQLAAVVSGVVAVATRVIVVDDGCTDGCVDAVRDLPAQIVSLKANKGKGHALAAGYREALQDEGVRFVASLDADGQHDPSELPKLYKSGLAINADLVIGSRQFDLPGIPWPNRLGNRLTAWVVGRLLGAQIPDTQSGYRILSRRFIEFALGEVAGGRYEFEMRLLGLAVSEGYTITSVPIQTIYDTGNYTSHFRKVRDSARIYNTLLRTALDARRNKGA